MDGPGRRIEWQFDKLMNRRRTSSVPQIESSPDWLIDWLTTFSSKYSPTQNPLSHTHRITEKEVEGGEVEVEEGGKDRVRRLSPTRLWIWWMMEDYEEMSAHCTVHACHHHRMTQHRCPKPGGYHFTTWCDATAINRNVSLPPPIWLSHSLRRTPLHYAFRCCCIILSLRQLRTVPPPHFRVINPIFGVDVLRHHHPQITTPYHPHTPSLNNGSETLPFTRHIIIIQRWAAARGARILMSVLFFPRFLIIIETLYRSLLLSALYCFPSFSPFSTHGNIQNYCRMQRHCCRKTTSWKGAMKGGGRDEEEEEKEKTLPGRWLWWDSWYTMMVGGEGGSEWRPAPK